MKTIATLLAIAMFSLYSVSFTSCSSMGGVTGTITTAQAWLNDPAHQAMINAIANTAIAILSGLGEKKGAAKSVAGQLADQYPDVPAGALSAIAKNPHGYIKH